MTKRKTKEIEIENAGPVREFQIKVDAPGVYVFRGPNGAGKSSLLRTLARALGTDVPVTLRRGAKTLSVTMDGESLLHTSKVKKTGDIEGALLKASPLARFILPDLANADKCEEARNEAFMELIDIPVTDKTIMTLVQDDEEVFEYVTEMEEGLKDLNIVDAKEKVRRRVHEMKRRMESIAAEAQGQIDAHTVDKPVVLSKVSSKDARTQYEVAIEKRARLKGQAEQRIEQEKERAEIEATLGERPDIAAAHLHVEQQAAIHEGREEQVAQLLIQLADLKLQVAEVQGLAREALARHDEATQQLGKTARQAGEWDRRKAILDTPITGATPADVEKATEQAERAAIELDRARVTESYQESCRLRTEAQKTREQALAKASELEKIATSVTGQLAELFSEAGVEGLTIDEGRLCVVGKDGQPGEPLFELSLGERTSIGCDLLARQTFAHDMVILPPQFWGALQPANQAEAAEVFAKRGQYVFTEEPTEGELRSEFFETEQTSAA